jgi:hypothetical protein
MANAASGSINEQTKQEDDRRKVLERRATLDDERKFRLDENQQRQKFALNRMEKNDELDRNNYDYKYSSEQKRLKDKYQSGLDLIKGDDTLTDEEKSEATRQLEYKMNGIKPTQRSPYPKGQDIGQVWNEDGRRFTRNSKGEIKDLGSTGVSDKVKSTAINAAMEDGKFNPTIYQNIINGVSGGKPSVPSQGGIPTHPITGGGAPPPGQGVSTGGEAPAPGQGVSTGAGASSSWDEKDIGLNYDDDEIVTNSGKHLGLSRNEAQRISSEQKVAQLNSDIRDLKNSNGSWFSNKDREVKELEEKRNALKKEVEIQKAREDYLKMTGKK